jgi:hypothetical protein
MHNSLALRVFASPCLGCLACVTTVLLRELSPTTASPGLAKSSGRLFMSLCTCFPPLPAFLKQPLKALKPWSLEPLLTLPKADKAIPIRAYCYRNLSGSRSTYLAYHAQAPPPTVTQITHCSQTPLVVPHTLTTVSHTPNIIIHELLPTHRDWVTCPSCRLQHLVLPVSRHCAGCSAGADVRGTGGPNVPVTADDC